MSPRETAADPDWLQLARASRSHGDYGEALACATRAVDARHDDVEALVERAGISVLLHDEDDARDDFNLALAFDPRCVAAAVGLARMDRESGDLDSALTHLLAAAQWGGGSAELHCELALTQNRQGDTDAAQSSYERALELEPGNCAAAVNLGLLFLSQRGDTRRALQLFERAAAIEPGSVAAQANLGLALQELGRHDEALAHYDRLIAASPEVVEYRWNRGVASLTQGDFARGWEGYELRHGRGSSKPRDFSLPEWGRGNPSQRNVLVYGEQGVGDEIMFASCLPDLLRDVDSAVLDCDPRLQGLLQRSFPTAHVHGAVRGGSREWLTRYPHLDSQLAIGSLPRHYRRGLQDFPQRTGYLRSDAAHAARWRSSLDALGRSLKVGICWRGGTLKTRREMRSLRLEHCMPLLQVPGCTFVCLNAGDCAGEVAAARQAGVALEWWPQALQNFEELAGLLRSLDVVISVPSSAAHLAGALGRPLWILLSSSPEWRYLSHGNHMPWYPSARLFRQARPGDWDEVIEAVAASVVAAARDRIPEPAPRW